MLWIFLSVLAGLCDSVIFAALKNLGNLDTRIRALVYNIFPLIFLPLGFLFYDIPSVSTEFYIITAINVFVWIIVTFLMLKSLQMSDLSTSVPMLSFTPVFLLFTSYFLLGEFPSFLGIIGVIAIVIGSYILNISSIKIGFLEPLKLIFKNKGIRYMFISSFLFSITANLAKIGIQLSNPAYFMFFNYLLASVILSILFFKVILQNKNIIKKHFKNFIIVGVATGSSELLAGTAFLSTIVPYAISLKRTSIIFSVIIGYLFFKEKHFKEAIIGSIIMLAGAILITLS